MSWFSGLIVYVIIWWLVLFMVLPWGVNPPENPAPGHAPSAPARPRILLKFAVTTAIATVLWGIAFAIIQSDLISFRPT